MKGPKDQHVCVRPISADLPRDAIALESIAGAYLFGDEKGPMLQRIYATAWETKEQLVYQALETLGSQKAI